VKGKIIYMLLVIFGLGAVGCSPPVPCSEGEDLISQYMDDIVACSDMGMVCNEAVPFRDACDEFILFIGDISGVLGNNPLEFMPDICGMFSVLDGFGLIGDTGTCQLPGSPGDPCIEAADCESENCTEEGFCE